MVLCHDAPAMLRDLARLTRTRFDLLVIGGGIHGLFAALDAASRGLSVALVERDDFGSGLSFNHQRTIHGGLRALQSGQILKTHQQIAERRAWALMTPHLIRPLPFLIGTYGFAKRSRLVVGTGLSMYDRLGRDRNEGLPAALHLPASRIESKPVTMRLFPGITESGLTGGAVWHDYQARHPDRINWLVAAAARRAGALLFNHTEAVSALRGKGRVAGARVRDRLTAQEYDVEAEATLLCAGSGTRVLFDALGIDPAQAPPLLRACNVLIDRPALDIALAAPGGSGRMLTAVPWSGRWLIGTFQTDQPARPDAGYPTMADVEEMIAGANVAFPGLAATRADVRLVHSGLTPAIVRGGRADLMPDSRVLQHGDSGAPGAFTVIGVKFTTARLAAREAIDRVSRSLGRQLAAAPGPRLLPHGSADGAVTALEDALTKDGLQIDDDVREHLLDWYATEAADVVRFAAVRGLTTRLTAGVPVLSGEVVYAVEHAMASRLADVVLRRTPLGAAGKPDSDVSEAAAGLMGGVLGWSAAQHQSEIEAMEARYPPTARRMP